MVSIRLAIDPIQSLGFASIGVPYMGIGPKLDHSARMIYVSNLTDGLLLFSFNGVDDHFLVPGYSSILLTFDINCEDKSEYFQLSSESRLYVKQIIAPSFGAVYLTLLRGINDV